MLQLQLHPCSRTLHAVGALGGQGCLVSQVVKQQLAHSMQHACGVQRVVALECAHDAQHAYPHACCCCCPHCRCACRVCVPSRVWVPLPVPPS
jgi:hypothetical protein